MDEDARLVRRCQRGDLDAFGDLVEKYQRPVFNAALRMVGNYETAKDIMQTTFVKAFSRLDDFNPSYRFFSWLYRITINESINVLKRESKIVSFDKRLAAESRHPNPEARMVQNEQHEKFMEALHRLEPKYRSLIVLKYVVGLSYEEIGPIVDLPLRTVKSRLYAARLLLREAMLKREMR